MTNTTSAEQRRQPDTGNVFNNVFQNSLQRLFQGSCSIANNQFVHQQEGRSSNNIASAAGAKNNKPRC